MATDFIIPKLGEGVNEATIVNWLVDDGAQVNEGDDILELETDKATIPVPANASGILRIGEFEPGDVVSIDQAVAKIEAQNGDSADQAEKEETKEKEEAKKEEEGEKEEKVDDVKSSEAESTPEASKKTGRESTESAPKDSTAKTATAPKATPVAQKMADDLGVDLKAINGSGDHGKITKEDVKQAASPEKSAESKPKAASKSTPTSTQKVQTAASASATAEENVQERIPLKGIRGVIARRMAESVQTTARVTLVSEADATELVALREQLKAIQKELGELDERAEEAAEFRKRIQESCMSEKVLKEAEKQLKRLEKMHPDTAEAATVRTYLEWMVEIP